MSAGINEIEIEMGQELGKGGLLSTLNILGRL